MPAKNAFQALYAQLNPAQKRAVDSIEGPVMVIAGPGTGKTTILTLRIANILRKTDTPAHGILAITYTDAGVKAMRMKLREVIGNRAHDVHIHTFHSFASQIITEYPDHFIHLDGMKSMTDIEQESSIRSILGTPAFAALRPVGRPDAYISGIIRSIDDAKREALTPSAVREYVAKEMKRIKNEDSSFSTRGVSKGKLKAEAEELLEKSKRTLLFADVYDRYEDKKRTDLRMDFNDIIIELLVALRNDPLLLRLIQERFLYIHVDEHQDTNDAQNFIIAMIAEFFETPNIFIVGDEKQAIYRFQGASVGNFLLLRKRWPLMEVISLDTNYRSHQGILDASFSLIENNYEVGEHADLRIPLHSGGAGKARSIDVVVAGNTAAVERDLARRLRDLAKKEPSATAAIIVRRNRDLDRIIRYLESQGIGVASERSVDIFKHPVGRLFFDLLEFIADPGRTDALLKTFAAGMWDMTLDAAALAVRSLRTGGNRQIEKLIPNLIKIRSKLLSDHAIGFILDVADLSGFTRLIASHPSYAHVWRGIVALAESLVRDSDIHDPMELVSALMAYRMSAESRPIKVEVGAPDLPFRVMTAHGSKGLEFDYVFIPYATEEAWVGKPRGSSFALPKKQATDSDIRDLRRLFYVALTRAKQHVSIYVPQEESDGRTLSPLRFLAEIDQAKIKESAIPRAEIRESGAGNSGKDKDGQAFVAIAKRVLKESGLSVTALNHFLECPNKFLYQSVLKLPQAPSASSEKGSAMHAAIAAIWRLSGVRSAEAIEKLLKKEIESYVRDSFLPQIEKDAVRNALIEDALAVAKALQNHFALPGTILTEHWVKAHIECKYLQENILVPIHGKLDAIVQNGDIVSVFDYKTRQALSIAAIKGETKNSDGGYFRQLVFYRLLLGEDPRWRNRRIDPALVFVSPDSKGRCPIIALPIVQEDVTRIKNEIQSLIDSVWSGKIARSHCLDADCEWCGLRGLASRN